MSRQFSERAPGGTVSGRKTVRRQAQGLVLEYDVASTAAEPVSVRLSDWIPTGRAEEFGFHEDHEPGEWTLSDGDLEMAVTLDPGAERTIVFGLVAAMDELAYEPADPSVEVDVRDDGDAGTATDDGETGDATDDGGGFFGDAGPSLDGGDEGGDVDLLDPDDEGQPPAGGARERPRVDADGGVVDSGHPSAGGVVSTLVDELEAGTVSESDLATLRDHLGVGPTESEAARLEYVQKRLGDFDAYVDALEELLSVHGSGEDAVTELEGRLEGFADDVEAVRERQDELADRMDDLADALDTHAETVESLQVAHEEDVAEVRSELRRRGETVREEVEDLRRSVDADLAALEVEIEAFESIRRRLVDGLRRPEETVGDSAVGDAEPDADDETEDVPIVEPSESHGEEPADERGDSDEPGEGDEADGAEESDEPIDGGSDATAWSPDLDRDVEESLETAVASNFSGSNTTDDGAETAMEEDEAEGAVPEEDTGPGTGAAPVLSLEEASDDESPDDSDDRELMNDEEQNDEEQNDDEEWMDDDGQPDDGFVSPVLDGGEGLDDGGDALEGDADSSEDEDGDEAADFEIPEVDDDDADDADGVDDAVPEVRDSDTGADDTGEDEGRATSIFEIGDVDSEAGDGEEKPTIDFEDH